MATSGHEFKQHGQSVLKVLYKDKKKIVFTANHNHNFIICVNVVCFLVQRM